MMRTMLGRLLLLWIAPGVAWAQGRGGGGGPLGLDVVQGFQSPPRDLPGTILTLINYVLVLVGVLALAYLVYGGFLYITSRGDDTQVEAAKNTLTYAIIGIVVVGIAAAVVNFVVIGILNASF